MASTQTPIEEAHYQALRNLERKGLIESRMCDDGKIRWFATEKGKVTRAEDVQPPDGTALS